MVCVNVYMHQSSGLCADVCAWNYTHQIEKTAKGFALKLIFFNIYLCNLFYFCYRMYEILLMIQHLMLRVFPTGGEMGGSKTCSFSSPPGKIISSRLCLYQIFISPHHANPPHLKQFSGYKPLKTSFLAVVIAPGTFLF